MSNIANVVQNDIARAVYLVDPSGTPISTAGSDGIAAAHTPEVVLGTYNGASVDQFRGNLDNFVLLASGAVATNGASFDAINFNGRGIKLYVSTGTFGAGATAITVTLQGKDPVSGSYYTILQSASLTASTFTVLSVYPGLVAANNLVANDVLPRTWRISWNATAWGTGGSTLGVSCAIIL